MMGSGKNMKLLKMQGNTCAGWAIWFDKYPIKGSYQTRQTFNFTKKHFMRFILFCLAILTVSVCPAQQKAEGLYDSLNGKIKSMTVYFYKIIKNAKGNFEAQPDYFSHHQEFIYDDNNVLLLRNFYEDKKKIRESRDMVAFNKPNPAVKDDTTYSSTDSSKEMLITRYRDGKINEYRKHITILRNNNVYYRVYMNADGAVSAYDMFVRTAEGLEKSHWQLFTGKPVNIKDEPYLWEKYNEHGHLMLSVYKMGDGSKKSTGRKYKYDENNNAVWIQFSEWNPATDKYEPVRETEISYKYRK